MSKIGLSSHFNYQKLLRFTLPSILMMMFTSVFGVIDDGLFVSNFVGKNAFVAINIMAPILTAVGAIAFMLSSGSSAVVAKTLGEGDERRASEYFSMTVYAGVIIGVLLTVIGYPLLRPFCVLLGAEGEVLENCLTYGRILLPFITLFITQNLFSTFLVTAEKPQLAMTLTILSGVINIIFDILLMVKLKLGIVGAVCATISGTLLTSIVPLLYFLFSKESKIRLVRARIDLGILWKSCLNGLSELISNISMALVALVFNYKLMRITGNDGVAAYGVIMYLSFVFAAAFLGYGSGVAPVIGFHFGAQNKDELKNLFRKSLVVIGCFGVLLFGFSELTARLFASVFVSYDTALLDMTVHGFRIYAFSLLFMGFNLFASSFFTALNDARVSGWSSFIRTFVFQIGTVLILPLFGGLDGIWFSSVAAEVLALAVNVGFFVRNAGKYGYQ